MRKRLSNDRWNLAIVSLCILGLFFVLTCANRLLTLAQRYGLVRAEIPVMELPINDQAFARYSEKAQQQLSQNTTAVILAQNGDFYFGALHAFSENFHELRNKFSVPQQNGEPQIENLLQTIDKWHTDRYQKDRIENDKLVVLVPANTMPIAIVTQVVEALERSPMFEHVILANGLL